MFLRGERVYKIFLVEDEIVVRESIRDSIDWSKTEFIFAGEASDGEMGLPMIQEIKPDILITDIRMPFMDGLELSKYIKKNMPWIKIIILSGHQEFEYAKKAISIGVEEYVLKPVGSKDLLEILGKVAQSIQNEKNQLKNVETMNKYLNDNIELMKERFLSDLVMGTIPSPVAADKASSFNITIFSRYYIVTSINIEIDSDIDYNQYLCAENIITEISRNKRDVVKFKRSLNEIIIILKGDERSILETDCKVLCEEIRQRTKEELSFKVSINTGGVYERIQGIAKSYKDIMLFRNADNNINNYEDMLQAEFRKLYQNQKDYLDFDDNMILNALRYEKKESIQSVIDKYFDRLKDKKISMILSMYLAIRINSIIAGFLHEIGESPESILPKQNMIEEIAISLDTPEKLKRHIEDSTFIAYELRERRKNSIHYESIVIANQYIEANFSDPGISLNTIANYVNISPCHFSTIYRQETGKTFIQHLTDLRIKEAKRLLNTTNMKTGEIALKVGYKESNYFSYIFKKNAGCKPKDYKNQLNK